MTTTRKIHKLRPGFLVLLFTCIVYFLLGYYVAARNWVQSSMLGEEAPGILVQEQQNGESSTQGERGEETSAREQAWNLLLVNREHPLQEDFEVALTDLRNNQQIDERAYPSLQEMMDDARAAGLSPLICSSYRTEFEQERLYREKVEEYQAQGYDTLDAEALASNWVAPPGASEHQTGLAVDIVAESYQHLDDAQADTPEQQWLIEHCWEYGFILRYPEEKVHVTGVAHEPWHYRYVGEKAALAMRASGQCLEEYLEEIP